jgi:hypothetical protein
MKLRVLILVVALVSGPAFADARQIDEYRWDGVERIVAIGDLHGDYGNYLATLRAAGLIDRKDKWAGGNTHLVQTGDIPDRGPDTLKIIEHISKLTKQAERKGGRVHSLVGNHEAMNMYGDLRYVHEGEYEAFVTRNSEALRDRYYELYLQALETQDPEAFAGLPENYREQWNLEHPLGWVEHRQAWDPAWNAEGEYANWVLERKVAIRINDTLFLHGGISGFYCRNALPWMTERVMAGLRNFDPAAPGIVEDEFGPLWYRGLSGVEPEAAPETVDAILVHHGVARIVVGHTPTSGVIWPQYGGRVVMIDTGIAKAYGGHVGYLEITPEGLFAGYPEGKLPLPPDGDRLAAYLEEVIRMAPDNPYLKQRLQRLQQAAEPASEPQAEANQARANEADETDEASGTATEQAASEAAPVTVPICGIAQ